ncbi:MAG: L-carnitine CoA-transferase [Eggerthellales bacterium]|nr:L-carnitine CoA-transferase [Eggerthellales bacterium]
MAGIPTEKPSFGVLDDVKVVFAAMEEAIPRACNIMADWGADVTWLENTGYGDTVRDAKNVVQAERRNCRSVQLNQFTPGGKEALLAILKDADIFMESSKGGTWDRKGFTDEDMWAVNPKLIIIHCSGYGKYGEPDRVKRAAYDGTVGPYAGFTCQNGTPEQPMITMPYSGDYINSYLLIGASLAALRKAERTGKGESIDWAMYEGIMYMSQYFMVDYLNDGIVWPRAGARNQNLCGIGVYQCSDGFIAVNLFGIKQNKWMIEELGLGEHWGTPELPEDTASLWLSMPIAQEFEKRFEAWLLERKRLDAEATLAEHAIAAQIVYEFEDMVKDTHMAKRGNFVEWTTADGDTFKGLSPMPRFEQTPGQIWRPAPHKGQDTFDVLTKAGLTPERIAELEAEGAIRCGE